MTQAALAAKLVKAGMAIGHIAKSGRNDFHKYDYVTDADVMDKCGKALDEVNVATVVDIRNIEVAPYGDGQFFVSVWGNVTFIDADSGDEIVAGFCGTGADKGDKGYYKAVTGGVKYAFLKTLRIPTGDDPEVDTTKQTKTAGASAGPLSSSPTAPQASSSSPATISAAQITKLKATLGDAGLKTDSQKKNFVTLVLGTAKPSRELTNGEMDAVLMALTQNKAALESALATV